MADAALLTDARALLFHFQRSGLKACRIVTPGLQLFFSRDPAIRASDQGLPVRDQRAVEAAATGSETSLTAPHIGTLVDLVAPGTTVRAGEIFGRIALLDEQMSLHAAEGGVLVAHHCSPGDLIEFGQTLATLQS